MKPLQPGLRGQHLRSQYQTVFFSLKIMMRNRQNKNVAERFVTVLEMILIIICNYNIGKILSYDVLGILLGIRLFPVKILWTAHLIFAGIDQKKYRILFTTPSPLLKWPRTFKKAICEAKSFMAAKSVRDNYQFKGKIERMNCLTPCGCFQNLV